MQVPDRLAGILPVIDGDPEPFFRRPLRARDLLDHPMDIHQDLLVLRLKSHQVVYMLFGYHEDVNRSFWVYVTERDGFVGFLNDCRGNLFGDNAAKQTIACTSHTRALLYQDLGEKMRRTRRSMKGIFLRKR